MSKLLLYCTKAKPYLNDYRSFEFCNKFVVMTKNVDGVNCNGKIVAECDFEVEKIELLGDEINIYYGIENKACLTTEQIENYLGYDNDYKGYAIHIKNLHIFDEPIKLEKCHNDDFSSVVNYAPQNMMYSWLYTDRWHRYSLISIRPEWLCKILNGEKTIEVRKKVLKEMLK